MSFFSPLTMPLLLHFYETWKKIPNQQKLSVFKSRFWSVCQFSHEKIWAFPLSCHLPRRSSILNRTWWEAGFPRKQGPARIFQQHPTCGIYVRCLLSPHACVQSRQDRRSPCQVFEPELAPILWAHFVFHFWLYLLPFFHSHFLCFHYKESQKCLCLQACFVKLQMFSRCSARGFM